MKRFFGLLIVQGLLRVVRLKSEDDEENFTKGEPARKINTRKAQRQNFSSKLKALKRFFADGRLW